VYSKLATTALGPSEKYAGGGDILILVDEFFEAAEFVEFEDLAGTNRGTS
jgi:hypothetical protein